ncbi:MAG: pirin family protein [Planctomycetota bacterium]
MNPTTSTPTRIEHRPAADRGATDLGWLDSRHSFSFGHYHDPRKMAYHGLRVLNDDRVSAGAGFPEHPHRDMEILTWVLDGQLAHQDSMGHASTLGPGSVQLMSAGTGVTHSEFNASETHPVHFLQIWVQPAARGTEPRYQEATPDPADRAGQFALLATPTPGESAADPSGALTIGADARVFVADLGPGDHAKLDLAADRVAYVHVATGRVTVNDQPAAAGDAVTLEGVARVDAVGGDEPAQLLAFVFPTAT